MSRSLVPEDRIRVLNGGSVPRDGEFVLYWMTANRRVQWNFSLDRAVEWARKLQRPLVILEALRCDYPWASPRLHQFVVEGMRDNVLATRDRAVLYYPYLEPAPGQGQRLLTELGRSACLVVTDDFPCFFLPGMLAAAAGKLDVRLEAVDSNGLYPLRAAGREFTTAFSFRAHLQKHLAPHLDQRPRIEPLRGDLLPDPVDLPAAISKRWPAATLAALEPDSAEFRALPLDASVPPVALQGGSRAGLQRLSAFVEAGLPRYLENRNSVEERGTSGLSPYLHFGHLSAHQIFLEVTRQESWNTSLLSGPRGGKREGWWNLSPAAEAYLDQLVTWRELGYQFCARRPDYAAYESLPAWARSTLEEHASDRREVIYDLETLEQADTHDEVWNAAQRQLVREGTIYNYLRMLWGKKVLEWSEHPRRALEVLIHLNNKYALDGRNPNSYSGIFWTLGRFDRAWGPERKIFGKIRYMSSENTARKLRLKPETMLARYT